VKDLDAKHCKDEVNPNPSRVDHRTTAKDHQQQETGADGGGSEQDAQRRQRIQQQSHLADEQQQNEANQPGIVGCKSKN
jgi:hypothetical protein